MSKSIAFIVLGVVVLALLVFSMTYTVNFHEVAVRVRFGKATADSIERTAGLKFRLPLFADKIAKIDTRVQLRESTADTIQTADGQQLMVRAFLMWRVITDEQGPRADGPLRFYQTYPGGVEEANQAIAAQFTTSLRAGLSRFTFNELIGAGDRLKDAEQAVKADLAVLASRGIEPVAVGISQLMLPAKTAQSVLQRMEATQKNLSNIERYKGLSVATGIEARAKQEAEKIRAFASARAEEIRAAGNRDMAVYLTQMSQEQGLAIFLSWLDALEAALSENTTLVIPAEFAPFHMMKLDTLTDARGIPLPPGDALLAGRNALLLPPAAAPTLSSRGGSAETPAPTAAESPLHPQGHADD